MGASDKALAIASNPGESSLVWHYSYGHRLGDILVSGELRPMPDPPSGGGRHLWFSAHQFWEPSIAPNLGNIFNQSGQYRRDLVDMALFQAGGFWVRFGVEPREHKSDLGRIVSHALVTHIPIPLSDLAEVHVMTASLIWMPVWKQGDGPLSPDFVKKRVLEWRAAATA